MSVRRPPLAVYSAKRRQRSISNPHPRPVPSSSPLKQLGEQDANLSIEEMSHRMIKRSRSSLKRTYSGPDSAKAASVGASPVDRPLNETRPTKKIKTNARIPLQTILEPSMNNKNTQDMLVDEEGTVDMDLTSVAQLKTPVPREGQAIPDDTTMNEESDFLSPLPTSHTAKRVVAHRSNSNLKENIPQKTLTDGNNIHLSPAPNDLASPFHSRPASPNSAQSAIKNKIRKRLSRTRSVGTDLRRRATMRSFSRVVSPVSNTSSPGMHRHPSLPSSQSSQKKENQDWFVPARLQQPIGQKATSNGKASHTPFVRESSFFNAIPEACSTPVSKNRVFTGAPPPSPGFAEDLDATPRLPLSLRQTTLFKGQTGSIAGEPTPRAQPMPRAEPTPRAQPIEDVDTSIFLRTEDSLFPDSLPSVDSQSPGNPSNTPLIETTSNTQPEHQRLTRHLSQDSIFSSVCDFSLSPTIEQSATVVPAANTSNKRILISNTLIMAPPSSPTVAPVSPASSDGDELRDMFSILGLDEDDYWFTSSFVASSNSHSAAATSSDIKVKKGKRNISSSSKNVKQAVAGDKRRTSSGSSASASSAFNAGARLRKNIKPRALVNHAGKNPTKQSRQMPTVKMKICDEPIQANDSSDELDFLKSPGAPAF
ncbi:hypothetical protein EW145_g1694 [Phellinidium pouzarii]|uniref:Uncharacterized protein n=1 Tax=Phellinidium pouzarii TaxID=167371 RepID=A0A4S4LDI6_9AGAM|nr:hypothetical protein EW145_g1694 [Phellinidium pouzarii]